MSGRLNWTRLMSSFRFQNTVLAPQKSATVAATIRAQFGLLSKYTTPIKDATTSKRKADWHHMAANTKRLVRRLTTTLRAIGLASLFIGLFLSSRDAIIASLLVSGICLALWWAVEAWEEME